MSNPSRFDKAELLSANGGWFFRNECLRPDFNIMQVEVRVKEDRSPLLPNTKCVMLLGLDAYQLWTGNTRHSLGEVRGSIYVINGIPHIPSYLPQDSLDIKDHESEHNELLLNKRREAEIENIAGKAEKRRHGITARINWKFFLKKDCEKAIRLVHNGGKVPEPVIKPNYQIYPSSAEIISFFRETKNTNLYVDLETDQNFNVKCIGCSSDFSPIYVIPLLTNEYKRAYSVLHEILRSFCLALNNNTVVSHNGSQFDWIVLPWKYHIPMGTQYYDTMLASHRCFPAVEKSLGHCTSLWTYEPFHKDEGGGEYGTKEQAMNLWKYCGKDIYTMMLIKHAIDDYAKTIPGLASSIQQVNESIPVYMLMTLMGMHYKQELVDKQMQENDRLMMQYLRCIRLLVGPDIMKVLQRKSKKGMPNSNVQCVQYFHDIMGYPVVARGKTRKDGNRYPSLAATALYKLRLKHDNPVIDFCLVYRELAKESGSLKFTPWMT